MSNASSTNLPCPFLGLLDDAATSLSFPSISNHCHHSRSIASPALKHQEGFCLGGKYRDCPVFLSQQARPLPRQLRASRVRSVGQRNSLRVKLAAGLAIALGIVLVLSWRISSPGMFAVPGIGKATQTPFATASHTATDTSPPTMTASPLPTATYTLAVSASSTGTPAHTPTRTRTAAPTSTPSRLDLPIGTDYKFVVHKVLDGENLELYATKYNTSVETILAVNYELTPPVWTDNLVLIPIGFTDVSQLPSFVVYQVSEKDRGLSVEMLAEYLRVSPLDLRYYNGWTSAADRPLVGDFLLVPRPKPVP